MHEALAVAWSKIMKNVQIILIFFLLSITAKAQEKEPRVQKNYTLVMDSLLRFVTKDQIKTRLLYDRVVSNAILFFDST